ncbi:MAG: hypothetical protein H8E31_07315, partial [Planctomycetes bacterium]|nr:hypothetical protein [Planctomycetota bacterium]
MDRRRVALQLLPTLAQGGAELYVYRLAKLQRGGALEPVGCSMLRSGPTEKLLRRAGVPAQGPGPQRAPGPRPGAPARDPRR